MVEELSGVSVQEGFRLCVFVVKNFRLVSILERGSISKNSGLMW